MPLFYVQCVSCRATAARMLGSSSEVKSCRCKVCEGKVKRVPRPPSTVMTERLDNGIMSQALVRPTNAEEMYLDHAKNDPMEKRNR